MSKKFLLSVLKWGFSIGILAFLIQSGKLSLTDLGVFLKSPRSAGITAGSIFVVYLICFWRWQNLLKGQGIHVPYGTIFKLGMLGQFFSSLIPGTVGGDLVKAVYVARRFPGKRVVTLSTILLDRVMGLLAIIIMASIAFIIGLPIISTLSDQNQTLIMSLGTIMLVASGLVLAFLALFSVLGKRLPDRIPERFSDRFWYEKAESLYEIVVGYKQRPRYLWVALGLGGVAHTFNMIAFFTVATAIFGPAPWGSVELPTFVMGSLMGMCAMAIPVAPMGLGVGQVAFSEVFFALGAASRAFGAPIITGFQIMSFCLNMFGVIFFATYRHEVQKTQLSPSKA